MTSRPRTRRWSIRCWYCGAVFLANRQTATLCSAKCRQRWSRATRAGTAKRHEMASRFVRDTYRDQIVSVWVS